MPISLSVGQRLKQAGLEWVPATHDFFSIPDVDMDEKIFASRESDVYVLSASVLLLNSPNAGILTSSSPTM